MKRQGVVCAGLIVAVGIWMVMLPVLHQAEAFTGQKAPEITSPAWVNSEPLSLKALRGKVVLVEFWTFGCYNCRNVEPQIKAWHKRYVDEGLVVIGIHTPEFDYEKSIEAVRKYVQKKSIAYPIAIDNDFLIWNRFSNRYWPAIYLVDKQGVIRYTRFGEGGYLQTEQVIQALLAESIPKG
jgi:thiol-disulfide isomerase/thioredoxin